MNWKRIVKDLKQLLADVKAGKEVDVTAVRRVKTKRGVVVSRWRGKEKL